jgi:hypothetical protein
VQEVHHKPIVYSDQQNLTYFETAVSLNRKQANWAEEFQTFCLDLFYKKGSSNLKANWLSWCLELTSNDRGTTAPGIQTLLRKKQQLHIGKMQFDDDDLEAN